MYRLAIVIPAYKSMYFSQALLSIANQTNKEFTLYIGDDCSPDNLYSIVEKYENRIQIVYKHFDENLGGKDLVAQWERCIDLIGDEEWIWLFSDDDMMDPTCVQNFYHTLYQNPDFDLFHFNVLKIDEHEIIIGNFYSFHEILTTEEFLLRKLHVGYFSTVVEYIFRKAHFDEKGRFQNFDLAWGSDDAIWIKLSKNKGIRNIENSKVYWRKSLLNISSIVKDKEIVIRKMNAQIEFACWIYKKSKQGDFKIEDSILMKKLEEWFIRTIQSSIEILSYEMISSLMKKFNLALKRKESPIQKNIFLYIYKIYRFFIRIIKRILFWEFLKLQKQKFKSLYFPSSNMLS
jgi:glycosyltransferase involved in cell wall biosynthesis